MNYRPSTNYADVIWLRNNYPPAMNYWYRVKEGVKKRERGRCQYCNGIGTEIHHALYKGVIFHEHLFINDREILIWTCRPCHIIQEEKKKAMKKKWFKWHF